MSTSSSSAISAPVVVLPPPEWDLLLSAAQKNQVDRARSLIQQQGVDPSHANAVGQSALHIAALWGHVEVMQVLIQAGARVGAINRLTGATPLHMATSSPTKRLSWRKRWAVIQCLIEQGQADPQPTDQFGRTPLEYLPPWSQEDDDEDDKDDNDSAQACYAAIRQALQPATPPLLTAIQQGDLPAVQAGLLAASSSSTDPPPPWPAGAGPSPVGLAVQGLMTDMESVLLLLLSSSSSNPPGQDLTSSSEQPSTPDLVFQTARTRLEILRLLQQSPAAAATSLRENQPNEPVWEPILQQLRKLYKQLPEHPQPQSPPFEAAAAPADHSRDTAAAVIEILEEAMEILGRPATISASGSSEPETSAAATTTSPPTTPAETDHLVRWLHQAARFNELRLLQFLVERLHMHPNRPGRQGMTALQFAARSGQVTVLKYLLQVPDLDLEARDDRGQTALDAALVNDKQEAVALLRQALLDRNS